MKLVVEDLVAGYGGEIIVDRISFNASSPALVQVLGPNGAGKTTLLKAILGLIKPYSGRVLVDGEDVTGQPERIGRIAGYVPQITGAPSTYYPITAWEMVESALLLKARRWPRLLAGGGEKKRVASILSMLGLPREAWHKNVWSLSGGQRQRVFIARAIVAEPRLIVMDEPLSSVDPAGKAGLAKLIGSLASEKLVVVTSHDPMLLLPYTKLVVMIGRGRFIVGPPSEALTLSNARLIYGEAVIPVEKHVHIADSHAA